MSAVDLAAPVRETTVRHPFAPALAMLAASVALLVGLSIRLPAAGAQVALIFNPGTTADRIMVELASVDARIVRAGGLDNIVIAHFEHAVSWSELRRRGVLLPLDPIMAGGCVPGPDNPAL